MDCLWTISSAGSNEFVLSDSSSFKSGSYVGWEIKNCMYVVTFLKLRILAPIVKIRKFGLLDYEKKTLCLFHLDVKSANFSNSQQNFVLSRQVSFPIHRS